MKFVVFLSLLLLPQELYFVLIKKKDDLSCVMHDLYRRDSDFLLDVTQLWDLL